MRFLFQAFVKSYGAILSNKQSGDLNPDNDTNDLDIDLSVFDRIGDILTDVFLPVVKLPFVCIGWIFNWLFSK